jgi:hypothetical protein
LKRPVGLDFPPERLESRPGRFRPRPGQALCATPPVLEALGLLAAEREALARAHFGESAPPLPLLATDRAAPSAGVAWTLHLNPHLGTGRFTLHLQPGVAVLAGGDPEALRHALHTLLDLAEAAGPGRSLPSFFLEDAPDFPTRGYLRDISRCRVPLDPADLLPALARLRFNQYQLYTEHTFAFAGHETVWRDASPLWPEEVLRLDRTGAEVGVELVPNFNSFGHWERWLRHPAYHPLAESPHGFTYPWGRHSPWGTTLHPTPRALRLLGTLFDQLLPHFRSRSFNVGCDETWELGQGRSRARCRRLGKDRVYLGFLLGIHRLVEARGRRMQFWGDIILRHPARIAELPPGVTALAWGYEAAHPFAEQATRFRASGVPYFVCPGTSTWRSLSGRDTNLRANLRAAATAGHAQKAAGLLLTDWGDEGHHQVEPLSYLPLALAARLAWRADPRGAERDAERLANRLLFRDPSGKAAAAFAEIGRLPDLFTRPFENSAVFQHLLFAQARPEWMDEIKARELQAAQARVRELRAADGPSGCADSRIPAEFHHTLDLIEAAIQRGLALLGRGADLAPTEWSRLRASHEARWRARSRPGGLAESLGKFPG